MLAFLFISRSEGKLDKDEFMFFLTGGVHLQNDIPTPDTSWVTEKMWDEICHLDSLPSFSGDIYKYTCTFRF
jgi:dynein heavy chain